MTIIQPSVQCNSLSMTFSMTFVQHNNKQHHRKVLLTIFHLNGHTLGFHPQSQKLELPCTDNKQHDRKVLLNSFELSHFRVSSTNSKLEG